jgi:membrane protein implicated in regulation of membrane protease activity
LWSLCRDRDNRGGQNARPLDREVQTMQWWTWFVLGTLLLAIELFAIDAQFFLIFIGAAAIVVGLIGMLGIQLPGWLQWLLFAALAVAAMATMRRQIYAKLRKRPHSTVDSDVHQLVRVTEELEPGKSTRIEYRGTSWTALNVGQAAIPAGAEVRIESVDGLTLHIRSTH